MNNRRCLYSLTDLIEKMMIDIIKEFKLKKDIDDFEAEIHNIILDINNIAQESGEKLSASIIRKIIALTIVNLFIWKEKELMWEQDGDKHLKLSHQLNGIRNQIKNILFLDNSQKNDIRTNVNVDNLEGWKISL